MRWVGRPPSTGLLATSCDNLDSYTLPEHGGLRRKDRAVTTCHLPLNRGVPSYPKVPVHPDNMLVYKETTHIPPGLRPYGSTSKDMGNPEGTTNRHLNLALLLIIQVI